MSLKEQRLVSSIDLRAQNPVETVRKVCQFIGKSLSDDQILKIVQATGFDVMSNDPLFNYSWWDELGLRKKDEAKFLRKGIFPTPY